MGVQFFEAAVEAGTDDLKTLSAIYSQLGNAYFYLQDYAKALEYHKHDLNLARLVCLSMSFETVCDWMGTQLCGLLLLFYYFSILAVTHPPSASHSIVCSLDGEPPVEMIALV